MTHQPVIIIVEPQMAENIGAIARCMKNFGLYNLRIVKPRCQWPDPKGFAMSAGADEILEQAPIYENFNDAIKDLTYLYASTARKRYMNKSYIQAKNLRSEILKQYTSNHTIGIVFGRESSGLTNEEVNICNKILVIDSNKEFSSLNIAQAVCIIGHEIFEVNAALNKERDQELCNKKHLEYFLSHLMDHLEKTSFFKNEEKKENMTQNIRNIFSRVENLSLSEVQTLHGIISALSNNKNFNTL
jgi:tRNA/rRNA methyltransferase